MFRDKFWISLLLSAPTLVWSEMVQHMFGFSAPVFPGSRYVPAVFGTAVFLYGGLVFVKSGINELRGYDYREFFGSRIALSNLEFRFPLIDEVRFPILSMPP